MFGVKRRLIIASMTFQWIGWTPSLRSTRCRRRGRALNCRSQSFVSWWKKWTSTAGMREVSTAPSMLTSSRVTSVSETPHSVMVRSGRPTDRLASSWKSVQRSRSNKLTTRLKSCGWRTLTLTLISWVRFKHLVSRGQPAFSRLMNSFTQSCLILCRDCFSAPSGTRQKWSRLTSGKCESNRWSELLASANLRRK